MRVTLKVVAGALCAALALSVWAAPALGRQAAAGALRGQVTDEFGGVIIGASVTAADAAGRERTATTDGEGRYSLAGLAPGRYTVRAAAKGFALYENAEVEVAAGRAVLDITLGVVLAKEEVEVAAEGPLSVDNPNSAGAVVLKGSDLDALPDDPEELAAALEALAGPAAGPNGGQITIDGFEGGRIPPKESIREVRVNENPLAAERDQPGFGGIQILTKPGTDRLRGSLYSTFTDESLNARNPFATRRADFQYRQFGGNLSGTVVPKKASFFFDLDSSTTDDNDIVNAVRLDAAGAPLSVVETVLVPVRRFNVNPRLDYQINPNHTLVGRYSFFSDERENQGVTTFSLPERAYDSARRSHTVQLTETAVLNASTVNETRFQFIDNRTEQTALGDETAVNVLESFSAGGANVGDSFSHDRRWEVTNTTTVARGTHAIKFGGRLRGVRLSDFSENNFNGTYTFGGGLAAALDGNDQVVFGADGRPVFVQITSLERYRRTVAFGSAGLPANRGDLTAEQLGFGPTLFSVSGGEPLAEISQVDFGGFVQDDWKIRQNLSVGAGLRYEVQSNLGSRLNFAPRVYVAWSPDGGGQQAPKTVFRFGFGIFYDRVAESLSLQERRFDGVSQRQFVVTDPEVLTRAVFATDGGVSNVPTVEELSAFELPQVTRRLAPDMQAPYSYSGGLIFERQLPKKFTVYGFLMFHHTRHVVRSRNVNAPLTGPDGLPLEDAGGEFIRPAAGAGDLYQFESSGTQNMRQVNVGLRNQINRVFSVFANYTWGRAEGDTDGPFSFPADQYDARGEYGRAAWDARHRFTFGGSLGVPYLNLLLNPIVIARTGTPFNITTGSDRNGDGIVNDRPAFADARTPAADLRRTPWGDFDINPKPGQTIIPRNYGEGPGFVSFNLRVSRQVSFGDAAGADRAAQGGGRQGRGGRGGAGGAAGGVRVHGPGGMGDPRAIMTGGPAPGGGEQKRYSLTFSLFFSNLLNRTNLSNPVGNLSSSRFGESLSTVGHFGQAGTGNAAASNRRINASVRFNF
ncbi:MAG TPA: carboxypeptidase regulatory-like domain-containing protein [Pyrinomonadaceae bacterium]|nr:carboxypeptidase regulatory-like domain-containing protein [Pyrinomonadaceae bacterium]